MKAIFIDPETRSVSVREIEPSDRVLERLCDTPSRPKAVMTFPNGDVLLAGEGSSFLPGFSLGGSKPIRTNALLLGRRDTWRGHMEPRSAIDRIAALVRWVEEERGDNPTDTDGVQAILIDPEPRSIEAVTCRPSLEAIEELLGGKPFLEYRAPGDDRVYCVADAQGARWRKDNRKFVGRAVIVGFSVSVGMTDAVTSLALLREQVLFAEGDSERWTRDRGTRLGASRETEDGRRSRD